LTFSFGHPAKEAFDAKQSEALLGQSIYKLLHYSAKTVFGIFKNIKHDIGTRKQQKTHFRHK
jgi:hypothetical protein